MTSQHTTYAFELDSHQAFYGLSQHVPYLFRLAYKQSPD